MKKIILISLVLSVLTFSSHASASSCGSITTSTTLDSNVGSSGTCFSIDANSVTLDCAGYTITGSATGYGIEIYSKSGITIKNCKITNFDTAIYVETLSNSLFDNLDIYGNVGSELVGMWLWDFNGNDIYNIDFSSNTPTGTGVLWLDDSDNNDLENITFNSHTWSGDTPGLEGALLSVAYGSHGNTVTNVSVTNNHITCTIVAGCDVEGGGFISSASGSGYDNEFNYITIEDNTITVGDDIRGGGLIGTKYRDESFNNIIISNNTVSAADVFGGGVFGFYSQYRNKANNITISDNTVTITNNVNGGGMAGFYSGYDHVFTNVTISGNSATAGNSFGIVGFSSSARNNILVNMNISDTKTQKIYDTTGASYVNYLIYNDTYGEVEWNSTNLSISGSSPLSLGSDIEILDNHIEVDTTTFSDLNQPAILSLYDTPSSGLTNPLIFRNGVECNGTTSPNCNSLTSLTAETVIFNVSGWSVYNLSSGPDVACSPTLNQDWEISDEQECDATAVSTGTGKIIVNQGGTLSLINNANITCNGVEINKSGHAIFIWPGSQLLIS